MFNLLTDDLLVNLGPSFVIRLATASRGYRQYLSDPKKIKYLSQFLGWSSENLEDFIGIYYTKFFTPSCLKHLHPTRCLHWAIQRQDLKLADRYFEFLRFNGQNIKELITLVATSLETLDRQIIVWYYHKLKPYDVNLLPYASYALEVGGLDLYNFYKKLINEEASWSNLLAAAIKSGDFATIKVIFDYFPRSKTQLNIINNSPRFNYQYLDPGQVIRLKILALDLPPLISEYLEQTFFDGIGLQGVYEFQDLKFHHQHVTLDHLWIHVYLALNSSRTVEHFHRILDLRGHIAVPIDKILVKMMSVDRSNELSFYHRIIKRLRPAEEPMIIQVAIQVGNLNVLNELLSYYQKSPYEIDELYKLHRNQILQNPGIYWLFQRHGLNKKIYELSVVYACAGSNSQMLSTLFFVYRFDLSQNNNEALIRSCKIGYSKVIKILLADPRVHPSSQCIPLLFERLEKKISSGSLQIIAADLRSFFPKDLAVKLNLKRCEMLLIHLDSKLSLDDKILFILPLLDVRLHRIFPKHYSLGNQELAHTLNARYVPFIPHLNHLAAAIFLSVQDAIIPPSEVAIIFQGIVPISTMTYLLATLCYLEEKNNLLTQS